MNKVSWDQKFKSFLRKHILASVILLTISISGILIYLINLIIVTPAPVTVDESNDWIGFYGSFIGAIISGAITWYSVFLTLRYNREKDQEDQKTQDEKERISVLPYLSVNEVSDDDLEIPRKNSLNFYRHSLLGNGSSLNTRC